LSGAGFALPDALVSISQVALCRAMLVLGCVTCFPGKLSLAIPPCVGTMSTSKIWLITGM